MKQPRIERIELPEPLGSKVYEIAEKRCKDFLEDWLFCNRIGSANTLSLIRNCYLQGVVDGHTAATGEEMQA